MCYYDFLGYENLRCYLYWNFYWKIFIIFVIFVRVSFEKNKDMIFKGICKLFENRGRELGFFNVFNFYVSFDRNKWNFKGNCFK